MKFGNALRAAILASTLVFSSGVALASSPKSKTVQNAIMSLKKSQKSSTAKARPDQRKAKEDLAKRVKAMREKIKRQIEARKNKNAIR